MDKISEAHTKKPESDDNSLSDLIVIIREIMKNEEKDEKGFANFSEFMKELYNKIPDFNPKNYGSVSSKATVFFENVLKKHFTIKKINNAYYLKVV
ncbi:hypothetical protein SHELI_v1c09410 [Spiroplasma helicoides]|uniref:HTH OST-type domain-containing protein n=1 Tax=Spiroplasma helicoides TaxID=216938 RepID=A0A1B3SLV9_9MOLU|nr:OST-HTH/LOTUS domain-containing protein [Spiroplasma helicoides]AOG60890.1 hypothetical protein SHELI_v1c09410 [Spiroplasma helicoides]